MDKKIDYFPFLNYTIIIKKGEFLYYKKVVTKKDTSM